MRFDTGKDFHELAITRNKAAIEKLNEETVRIEREAARSKAIADRAEQRYRNRYRTCGEGHFRSRKTGKCVNARLLRVRDD